MILRLSFVILVFLGHTSLEVEASLVQTFQVDSGLTGMTSVFSSTFNLVADGVTFDATITATGSGTLTQSSGGLGVSVDTSDLVSNGEHLLFSMAVSNIMGGALSFDGFTGIDFNNFGSSDAGVLSVDSNSASTGDNFFTTTTGGGDETFTAVASFHAIAGTGSPGSNSFRVDDVTAQFTGTAVPEPRASVLIVLGTLIAVAFASLSQSAAHNVGEG